MASGAGHIADMNTRLRQNRSHLGKKGHFKINRERYISIAKRDFNDTKNLTEADRLKIRNRLVAEKKAERQKKIMVAILSLVATILLTYGFLYFSQHIW